MASQVMHDISKRLQGVGGVTVAGMVHSGTVQVGESVLVAPGGEEFIVKSKHSIIIHSHIII